MENGYTHRFGKTVGGIDSLLLTPVCNIHEAVCDSRSDQYISIRVYDPAKLTGCTFAENAAQYREETELRNGIPSVVHRLEFDADKTDPESDRFIRALTANSCCGLAAIVTTRNHTRLVIGFSEEHAGERPLRLEKVSAGSGKKPTDTGYEAISLISRDTAKARLLNGTIG